MRLALGTVQFGLAYGVAGRDSPVPPAEARRILERAAELGVGVVDTAAAYGDIEDRLLGLTAGLDLQVVTKLPARPAGLRGNEVGGWAQAAVERAIGLFGPSLHAILFHRAEDLLDAEGDFAWRGASDAASAAGVALGVSGYEPATVAAVSRRHPIALAQLPGNALDQSLRTGPSTVHDVHVRSAFLQGLLLMDEAHAARRVPAAAAALRRWHGWCAARDLSPLIAALGCVKALPASHCVVGVDSLDHLEQVAAAWAQAPLLDAPELAVEDRDVIDPRRWGASP